MDSTLTTFLAIWGAVLGSLSLAWNVWTWLRGRPRIVAKVKLREWLNGHSICYEIRNRGDKPTTIEEIMLVKYQDGFWGLLGQHEHVVYASGAYRETAKLPSHLAPGEVWKGYSPIPDERGILNGRQLALIEEGRYYFKIQCAHTDRLLKGKVRPENFDV